MNTILLLYSTTDGHTKKISQRIQQQIEAAGNRVVLDSIENEEKFDLKRFDKIVIGASIRYGKHSPLVYDFINRHRKTLDSKPNAFFSVSVVARKPNKNRPDTNPYFKKFLKQIGWKPGYAAVFAGRINYSMYSFWDRNIIRLIMWITKGPTDPKTDVEFTRWEEVDAFGRAVCEL